MQPQNRLALLTVAVLASLPIVAYPDGCMMPSIAAWRRQRERSLINEPDQKALIFFKDGQEQLIISPSYQGAAEDFAWVVPVPSRPRVQILTGAPFHELARLVEPAPPRRSYTKMGKRASNEGREGVTVLERKTVGDYDVSVLKASDSQALTRWLAENQYHLPAHAVDPIQTYIRERWTFVACRIKTPREQTREGLESGVLSPLRLTFAASQPIYPMRLSAANPSAFTTLLYIALPFDHGSTIGSSLRLTTVQGPGLASDQAPSLGKSLYTVEHAASFPTLARLAPRGCQVFWFRTSIRPEQCREDYVWEISHGFRRLGRK